MKWSFQQRAVDGEGRKEEVEATAPDVRIGAFQLGSVGSASDKPE